MSSPLGDIDPRELNRKLTKQQTELLFKAITAKPRKRKPLPMKAFRAAVARGIAQAQAREG